MFEEVSKKKKIWVSIVLGLPVLVLIYGLFAFFSQVFYNVSVGRSAFLYAWNNPATSVGVVSLCGGIIIAVGILKGLRGLFYTAGFFSIIFLVIVFSSWSGTSEWLFAIWMFLIGGFFTIDIFAFLFGLLLVILPAFPIVLFVVGIFFKNKIYRVVCVVIFTIYLAVLFYKFVNIALWTWT